jgi:hypothetical protein
LRVDETVENNDTRSDDIRRKSKDGLSICPMFSKSYWSIGQRPWRQRNAGVITVRPIPWLEAMTQVRHFGVPRESVEWAGNRRPPTPWAARFLMLEGEHKPREGWCGLCVVYIRSSSRMVQITVQQKHANNYKQTRYSAARISTLIVSPTVPATLPIEVVFCRVAELCAPLSDFSACSARNLLN